MGALKLEDLPYYTYADYLLCDPTDDIINFDIKECTKELNFDFSKIW